MSVLGPIIFEDDISIFEDDVSRQVIKFTNDTKYFLNINKCRT